MNTQLLCETTVAFTGHRLSRIPYAQDPTHPMIKRLKYDMCRAIRTAIDDGYIHFISGMATGFDRWAAFAVTQFQQVFLQITLECAVPYRGHSCEWEASDLLQSADRVSYISEQYYDGCMLKRNRYMVDHASRIIALYFGDSIGGTAYTLQYAKQHQKEIVIIN